MKRLSISMVSLVLISSAAFSQTYKVGDPAPFFSLARAGGGTLALSDFRGQIVFLNFIGYACPYCIDEAPEVEANIWQAFKDKGVQVVALDTWDGSEASVLAFSANTKTTFPVALKAGSYARLWNFQQNSFAIIDGDGVVQYIAPLSTPYSSRYAVHEQDMIDKLMELVTVAGVKQNAEGGPGDFQLHQSSPNPFSTATRIRLDIGARENGATTLFIYDLLGRRVTTLHQGHLSPGTFDFQWAGRDDAGKLVPGGVYFYVLQNAQTRIVKKLLYVRQ
jgi:peroxiredoxin